MPWDYSTIYWNFSVAFFVHTAHGCLIQMCHQNYSKLSGTFFAGEILILYRANSRFRVPPGSNLNLSLMTVYNPFGDTFQLQIVDVHPFLSLISARTVRLKSQQSQCKHASFLWSSCSARAMIKWLK